MEKTNLNKLWNTIVACALLGGFLSSWLAPKLIAWYFDPPVDIGVNCRAATEWSMSNLQKAQFVGIFLGAAAGFALSSFLNRRKKHQEKAQG